MARLVDPEFHMPGRPGAVRQWESFGLPCRIYWGVFGFNGYVRLPKVARGVSVRRLEEFLHPHGGITYGPDRNGWIGMDTAHAGDDWPDDSLNEVFGESTWPLEVQTTRHMRPGLLYSSKEYFSEYYRPWTMAKLVREVDQMALLIAEQYLGLMVKEGMTD